MSGIVFQPGGLRTADSPLRQWDVVTKIGDTPIDDEGMVRLRDGLRVYFRYEVQKIARGGTVPLTLVRAGKEMTVALPVPTKQTMLIPDVEGDYPSYFVWGPLAFTEANGLFIGGLTSGTHGAQLPDRGGPQRQSAGHADRETRRRFRASGWW